MALALKAIDAVTGLSAVVDQSHDNQQQLVADAAAAVRADIIAALPDAIAKAIPAPAVNEPTAQGQDATQKALDDALALLKSLEQQVIEAKGQAAEALEYVMSAPSVEDADDDDALAKALIDKFADAEVICG